MKRKIIVTLISFATVTAFNGVIQAGYLRNQFEEISELPIGMHANGAIIKTGKNRSNSELFPSIRQPEMNRKENNQKIPANKNQ